MTQSRSPSSKLPGSLSSGDRLGPYEVQGLLGAGGMGEVYRAHDPRLGRDVALKVLRRHRARQEDVERFGREARAAGGLSHPNIVAVHDVGTEGNVPYVVTELLEGHTLRSRLDHGPLPLRKAVDWGIQIAQALDAAHAKNIWHCDVKPANVFITRGGQVKLLDFGIARLGQRTMVGPDDPTGEVSRETKGLGTAGYMAPEQILSKPVDGRADVFALGVVLYEMFTGARAFKRETDVETLTAVLRVDPVDPAVVNKGLPPMAAAIVRRCLEKDPEERFQSARDLAFSLHQLQDSSTGSPEVVPGPPPLLRRIVWPLLAVALAAVAFWVGSSAPPLDVSFTPVTFTSGVAISGARFTSDGGAVVYSQARQGTDAEVWSVLVPSNGSPPNSQPERLDYDQGTDLLAAGPNGAVALLMDRQFLYGERFWGRLTTVVGAGSPTAVYDQIEGADFGPGDMLAVVRSSGPDGPNALELGRLGRRAWEALHTTPGALRFPRVSPNGRWIAFVEDADSVGTGGTVSVISVDDRVPQPLSERYRSVRGLAWTADSREIWFAADNEPANRALRAVDLDGRERLIQRIAGSLTLWDIDGDGRVLITRDEERRSTRGIPPGETIETDFAWYDETGVAGATPNGAVMLFRDRTGLFTVPTDGSRDPMRVDAPQDLFADAIRRDGSFILATQPASEDGGPKLLMLPTEFGAVEELGASDFSAYLGALFFPVSDRILFNAAKPDQPMRAYVQSVADRARPWPITAENAGAVLAISPDEQEVATVGTEDGIAIWPVDVEPDRAPEPSRWVLGSQKDDRPVAFSDDGQSLFVFRREVPAPVYRVDIATGRGREEPVMRIPQDVTGVYSVHELWIRSDGQAYFYSYQTRLSQLYVVRGLR